MNGSKPPTLPLPEATEEENNVNKKNMEKEEEEVMGCKHYKRRCKLVAPCCGKAYNCRFCHDEAEENHTLDRQKVQEVECLGCGTVGPTEENCGQCGVKFGKAYFCPICRLYDDQDKGQFHCIGCGICRIGGRDSFTHCDTCGLCLPKQREPHKCIANSSKVNCPVCMEDIHTSRLGAHIPPCSHLLHSTCYHDMLKRGLYACPTCGLSMQDMASAWASIDREVAATPMPRVYSGLYRQILCKDCNTPSTVIFHIVGMKCDKCGSYNTTLDKGPLLVPVNVAEGEERKFRPLTEKEEKSLEGANFPLPATVSESEEDDQDGWESIEEELVDAERMVEEELD